MENPYGEIISDRRDPNKDIVSAFKFAFVVLALFAFFIILFTGIFAGVRVDGDSMMDTLHDGDYLFMNQCAEPDYGDIVVVHTGRLNADYVIKRVIALEGDEIYAKDGVLYRKCKGEAGFSVVEEPYLYEEWLNVSLDKPNTFGSASSPIVIGEGEIFYMGDNRNVSVDCRAYGAQDLSEVSGVITGWSLKTKGFFTGLFRLFS